MKISIIAAKGKNNVIGSENKLIWHLPKDLNFFQSKTLGHFILMGKNTYLSLGKKLKGRKIIVLTRDKDFVADGCLVVHNINDGLKLAKDNDEQELFIGGGQQIYSQFLDIVDKMYLTHVDCDLKGDSFFPDFTVSDWSIIGKERFQNDDKHKYSFDIVEYVRI
jgi:dihydrofolate reductase